MTGPSEENGWTVPGECARCGQTSCICKPVPRQKWKTLTEALRETEREIAIDPGKYGITASEWERVRQWPGES